MYFNLFLAIFFQQKRDTSLKEASLTLYLPTTASQSDVRPLFSGVPWKGEPEGETRATQLLVFPPQLFFYFNLEMINSFIWPGLHFPFISFMI